MKWVWDAEQHVAVNLDQTANIEIQETNHGYVVIAFQANDFSIALKRPLTLQDAYEFVSGITGAAGSKA